LRERGLPEKKDSVDLRDAIVQHTAESIKTATQVADEFDELLSGIKSGSSTANDFDADAFKDFVDDLSELLFAFVSNAVLQSRILIWACHHRRYRRKEKSQQTSRKQQIRRCSA
jgi:hypothetical protein